MRWVLLALALFAMAIFAAGPAKRWELKSEIIVREGDFPDTDKTSDQRPIRTTVKQR